MNTRSISVGLKLTQNYKAPADEIDFLTIFKMFWQIRYVTLLGGMIGLAVVVFLMVSPSPQVYQSQITVQIEPYGISGMDNPDQVVDAFRQAFASRHITNAAFKKILDANPQLGQKLAAAVGSPDFTPSVMAENLLWNKEDSLIRIEKSGNPEDFIIIAKLPNTGMGKDAPEILVSLMNGIAEAKNSANLTAKQVRARISLEHAQQKFLEAHQAYAPVQQKREIELARLRTKLAQLEYGLLSRLLKAGINAQDYLRLASPDSADHRRFQDKDTLLNFEGVIRLIGALSSSGIVSAGELEKIQSNLASLKVQYVEVDAKYAHYEYTKEVALKLLSEATKNSSQIFTDMEQQFLPTFRLDKSAYESQESPLLFEALVKKRYGAAHLAAGFLFSALLAGLIALTYGFVKKIWPAMKQQTQSPAPVEKYQ